MIPPEALGHLAYLRLYVSDDDGAVAGERIISVPVLASPELLEVAQGVALKIRHVELTPA